MKELLNKIFGDPNKKVLDGLQNEVQKINKFEEGLKVLSDEQLRGKTLEFKAKLEADQKPDDFVCEAFAVVREASRRQLGQRHFDVQLIGGLVLHKGGIAEMRTGEGKTLTATAPVYVNAILGKGVHVVTVNDYLARRDTVWMGQIYHALGLTVGCIAHECGYVYDPAFKHDTGTQSAHDSERDTTGSFKIHQDYLRPVSRKEAYACDITHGTNNEFGFDYLRDNMVSSSGDQVQRELNYAIVDEVDSILIDEARTPLIISAPAEESAPLYFKFAELVRHLKINEDYNIDEKMRTATITEHGIEWMEKALGIDNLYVEGGMHLVHHLEQALRAQTLYQLDRDYVVKSGEVIIVDEFTGRLMPGRRYSEGLHQAIEAKEGVAVQRESMTMATITFQNYFRLYKKLGGMTGTAATEAEEFSKIYNLEVTTIPTNLETIRHDLPDRVFKNEKGKFEAVVREIKERNAKGQPVLIGTASIEKNEMLSGILTNAGIQHNVLNAKNHEKEAEIIAQAGRMGAVTVATNMAGRGVDIVLGGNPPDADLARKVRESGGLFVMGTERHESRRIDNQLRGRCGRQGDPGETQFYISMQDDLMRIFGSDRSASLMSRLGVPDDMPIESKILTRSIEKAQQSVEGHNFDIRKHTLEYDDVLNKHREVMYGLRKKIISDAESDDASSMRSVILELMEDEIEQIVYFHTGDGDKNSKEIAEVVETIISMDVEEKEALSKMLTRESFGKVEAIKARTEIIEKILELVARRYNELENYFTDRNELKKLELSIVLRTHDSLWVEHLNAMSELRKGIGLQGYGQRDPLIEYKKEAYQMYNRLRALIISQVVYNFFKYMDRFLKSREVAQKDTASVQNVYKKVLSGTENKIVNSETAGRNDPCPCGAVKPDGTAVKYKHCHGK